MEKNKGILPGFFENKVVDRLLSYLYPVIIGLFAICRVNMGLDITDTAYNYSNFNFLKGLDDMWFYSTFLSNLLGRLFTLLPFGNTMLGLNFYTSLVKVAILLTAFFFLVKKVKLSKHLVFLGLMMAAGLNWCPTAVLYNYLTYLFLLLGVIFLYEAETSNQLKRENLFFFIAGIMLGMNVFVRLPNLCEAALIIAVWYMSIIRKESFLVALRKTLICLGGYVTAFLLCVLMAVASRSFFAYVRGISQMFEGGGEASSQYSFKGLIFSAFSGYIGIKYWAFFALLALFLVGLLSFAISKFLASQKKDSALCKVCQLGKYLFAAAVFILTIVKFIRTDLYSFRFYEYSSMYGINVIALLIAIVLFAIMVFDNNYSQNERFLAMSILIVIGVTPLGSNNGMYSVLNNLYLALPLMLCMLFRKSERFEWIKAVKVTALMFVGVAFLHSILFGLNFSFRDGGGEKMSATVDNNEILKGMKTIPSNAQFLSEATEAWKNGYEDSTILVFGNAAGLSFYMDAKPAISTVWPSLASFSLSKFENEMAALKYSHFENGTALPLVVLGKDGFDAYIAMAQGDTSEIEATLGQTYIKKLEILYDFLNNYGYSGIYYCDTFWVLAPNEK